MKSSASESIRNGYFNLERLSRSSRLAWPGISTLERLWFRRRTFHVPNLMHKLLLGIYFHVFWKPLAIMISFPATVLGTAVERLIKSDVWINRRIFVNLGRSKFEFSSAHEKYGVWTGPYFCTVLYLFKWSCKDLSCTKVKWTSRCLQSLVLFSI